MQIRDVEAVDEAEWRRLWAGYLAFYEAEVPDATTALTWQRMLTPGSGIIGRIAVADGAALGFSVSVLHPGTWKTTPVCYLEDLFVAPGARGHGIGRALIEDLLQLAKTRGWSGLYWHTRASNAAARRLYDRFTLADDFVRYRLSF